MTFKMNQKYLVKETRDQVRVFYSYFIFYSLSTKKIHNYIIHIFYDDNIFFLRCFSHGSHFFHIQV